MSDLTFDRFQEIQLEWADENFGEQPAAYALFGLMEELGELSRAHLKGSQGIRGDEEKWETEARKEIGDIATFLAQYASARGWSLGACVEESWKITSDRNWQDFPEKGHPDEPVGSYGTNSLKMTGSEASVPIPTLVDTSTAEETSAKKETEKSKKHKYAVEPDKQKNLAFLFPDRWAGELPKPEQLTGGAVKLINAAVSEAKKEDKQKDLGALGVVLSILGKAIDGSLIVDNPPTIEDTESEGEE
jgi:NTP pyrophosphatase (non-canonical NTP hydrolase)